MAAIWAEIVSIIGNWLQEPQLIVVAVLLMVFVGWVVRSEDRTRHLVSLIRALRQPGRTMSGARSRRPMGR